MPAFKLTTIYAKAAPGGDGRIFGLILGPQSHGIDITDEQLPLVQEAVDRGSVEVDGFAKAAPKAEEKPVPKMDMPAMAKKSKE